LENQNFDKEFIGLFLGLNFSCFFLIFSFQYFLHSSKQNLWPAYKKNLFHFFPNKELRFSEFDFGKQNYSDKWIPRAHPIKHDEHILPTNVPIGFRRSRDQG